MARTRWPPDPENPGLLPRPGRSDRQRRWVPQKPGPGRQIDSQDSPSGVSRFGGQAGTQAPTLRPRQIKAREAGPEALPTSSLPIPCGWHPCRTQSGRHADCPVRRAPATATARARGWAKHTGRAWHCWFRAIATTICVVYEGARAQGLCSAPVCRPTAAVTIVIAVLLLVVLGLIELIGRPSPHPAPIPPATGG
jgi:hypothetical protein